MDRFQDFTCLYSSKTQLIKKNRNHRIKYRIQTKALKSEGQKYGNGEFGKFSIEIWVGPQISVEKNCIFGKKLVGPKNAAEKLIYGKNLMGGCQI